MVNGSDCLQIRGRAGLQLIRGRIQEYVVSCGMITYHFNMFGIITNRYVIVPYRKIIIWTTYWCP